MKTVSYLLFADDILCLLIATRTCQF